MMLARIPKPAVWFLWFQIHPKARALTPSAMVLLGVIVWCAAMQTMGPSRAEAGSKATPMASVSAVVDGPAEAGPPVSAPIRAVVPPPSPEMIRAAVACFSFVAKQPGQIRADFEAAGLSRMTELVALEDEKRVDASRVRLQRLQARLNEYEKRIRASAADVPAKIQASRAASETKEITLAAVRKSGGDLVRDALEFVALQRKTLTRTDALLGFMRSRSERFTVENRRLLFADKQDQKRYDEQRTQLDEVVKRQDSILRRIRAQGDDAIAAMQASFDTTQASIAP
jgi:hypothetical protein